MRLPLLLSAALVLLCLVGCSSSAHQTTGSASAPAHTLAPFVAAHGWTVVTPLGYVSPGVVTSGTSFVADKPYQIEVVCEGKGSLTVTVSSPDEDAQVFSCTAASQTFSVVEFHPPVGQHVHVNVSAEPSVVWEGALETQA